MAPRKMSGSDEIVVVGQGRRAERVDLFGQMNHLAGQQRVVKGQHRTAVSDRVQAKFLRVQHPHELRQHALDFVQCLRAILSRSVSHWFDCDKSRDRYAISFSAVREASRAETSHIATYHAGHTICTALRDTRRERTEPHARW